MGSMVLLLHTLPDGSSHFDWMLQRDGPPDDALLTFRLAERPDSPAESRGAAVLIAERLTDHRADYLTYEGPVSGNRGSVRRLASGTCTLDESDGLIDLTARFESAPPRRWIGRPESGGSEAGPLWRFVEHV